MPKSKTQPLLSIFFLTNRILSLRSPVEVPTWIKVITEPTERAWLWAFRNAQNDFRCLDKFADGRLSATASAAASYANDQLDSIAKAADSKITCGNDGLNMEGIDSDIDSRLGKARSGGSGRPSNPHSEDEFLLFLWKE